MKLPSLSACLLLILSCAGPGGGDDDPPLPTGAGDLRKRLAALEAREDPEGLRDRAEACERLLASGVPDAESLRIRRDEARFLILSQPAPDKLKREAAEALAKSLELRAQEAGKATSEDDGPLRPALRKLLLLIAASLHADYAVSDQRAELLQKVADAQDFLADAKGLIPEAGTYFKGEVRELLLKSMAAKRGMPAEATAEARKFCELSFQGHLEEGTRNADFGTREKADRSKALQVIQWYLRALTHFALVRETRVPLSPSQANALGRQDIVIRSLYDLLRAP